ncbi:MAG TPA: hypothetical protein ENO11_05625, partial [Desulfobacteraceae bacterium]|nr:hypothetical protein [Desulfobacteraceae bacterium]
MKWKENITVLLLATAAAFSISMATAWAANESCMGCHEPHDNCARCHAIPDHHSNANATVGNCEYCHADPRGNPDLAGWNVPAIGDNGHNSGSSYPTQLACRECHVSYSNGEMIISRFTRSDYNKYTT